MTEWQAIYNNGDLSQLDKMPTKELYKCALATLQIGPLASYEAEEFDELLRHLSYIAVRLQCELGWLKDKDSERLSPLIEDLMMLIADKRIPLPDLSGVRESRKNFVRKLRASLEILRSRHAHALGTVEHQEDQFNQGFNHAKELIGSQITPRRLLAEDQKHSIWLKTSGKCVYCDINLAEPDVGQEKRKDGEPLYIDHLVPKSCGGPDHMKNYVPSCQSCNSRKSAKDPVEFVFSLRKIQRRRAEEADDLIPF